MAITSQQFPKWKFSPETWLLTCLFHDIGTIDKHTHGTLMSFEFYGGILALQKLKELNGPISQAESVSEAIIRHQDPVEIGNIHTIGLLI
jgi:cyanamide hydratase